MMRGWTHREYLTRLAWIGEEWNRPSREDVYRMQIAAEVRRANAKDPNRVDLEDFKLKFKERSPKSSEVTKQQRVDLSKAVWQARLQARKK